jgi:5'-deoxynucleotidase YfbR-like HD superfamily hydrolase
MVLMKIAPDRSDLLPLALTHDLHEVEAGDIPYPFKKNNPAVRDAYATQEHFFAVENGFQEPQVDEDIHLLKWADMYELLLWSFRENNLGNRQAWAVIERAIEALDALGPPTAIAYDLIETARRQWATAKKEIRREY